MDDHHAEPLTPQLLLRLWRDRWGKSDSQNRAIPFLSGQLSLWTDWLAQLSMWAFPGVTIVTWLGCLFVFSVLMVVQFSLNDQLMFSAALVCMALYARPYAGHLVTLLLVGLSVVVSARYMYWRLSSTLVHDNYSDLLFGLGLCLAELHLWLLTMTSAMRGLWPVKKKPIRLPKEPAGWPGVDIFVLCKDQSANHIRSTAAAAQALNWPGRILKIHLLDNGSRDEIRTIADSMAISYLTPVGDCHDRASLINHALGKTDGSLIAIIECHSNPDADLLKTTLGWFLRETNLAMMQTPGHFLAPAASDRVMGIFEETSSSFTCALIRRSMLTEIGGIASEPVTRRSHTALKLQALGYSTAYLGFSARSEPAPEFPPGSIESRWPSDLEPFLAYRPFGDYSLLWKLRLASFQEALEFFRPMQRLAYFLAPATCLLFGLQPIQTSAVLLGAYALPHLTHAYITNQRRFTQHRFSAMTDIWEAVLASHVLCITAMTLWWTELAQRSKAWQSGTCQRPGAFDWKGALPYLIIFALNLAALAVGLAHLLKSGTEINEMNAVFVVWSLYNVMILTARLAVAEEGRDILRHTRNQMHLAAMIRLASGRTMSCTTENFPELDLSLKLPAPMPIENQSTVNISIFHNHHEFSFPVQVTPESDLILRARIDGPARIVYQSLVVAAYSRGQDWPKWLPAQDTGDPLPKWLVPVWTAVRGRATHLVLEFVRLLRMKLGRGWMQIRKKK
jgi:cellulose synthase (UDP-forming)